MTFREKAVSMGLSIYFAELHCLTGLFELENWPCPVDKGEDEDENGIWHCEKCWNKEYDPEKHQVTKEKLLLDLHDMGKEMIGRLLETGRLKAGALYQVEFVKKEDVCERDYCDLHSGSDAGISPE